MNRDYEGVYNASDAANTKFSGKAPKVSTRVMAFLKRGVPGPKKSFRPAKRRRVKSLQWLMNYHETHKHASGGALGLHTLVQPEDHGKRKSSFLWPSASVCTDQGPPEICALHWARVCGRMNLDSCYDLSHLGSNALQDGESRAGLSIFSRLMVLAYRCRHGPYDEATRWGQAKDAIRHMLETESAETCHSFVASCSNACEIVTRRRACMSPTSKQLSGIAGLLAFHGKIVARL